MKKEYIDILTKTGKGVGFTILGTVLLKYGADAGIKAVSNYKGAWESIINLKNVAKTVTDIVVKK